MRCAVLFSGMATLGGGLGSLHFAVVRHSSQNAPLTHLFNLHYSKSCARRGFVLRACIRRADEVRVEATLVDGPADTTFFRRCNMDWRWPPTYGSGPFAPATPCTHVPGRYSGPNKFKRRVAHPWSWDIGSSTSAAQTSLNMVLSRRKARPFGLSTKLGLQENGRPSPKGTTLWPGPYSMD